MVYLFSQNEPERFNSQHKSPQRRRTRRHHTLAAGGLEGRGDAQQVIVVIGATGEGQAHRHADIGHHPHGDCDGRHAEMANGEVAVGDPDAIAPGDVGGGRVHIRIGRAHVCDCGEEHGVELELVHPVLEIQLAGLLQAAQAVRHCGDLVPGFQTALGHIDVLVHAGRQIPLAVRQCARIVGEDLGPVDVLKLIELGIAVGTQEVVKGPAGELPQLVVEELW